MADYSLVSQESPPSVVMPVIPLNFVYPGLTLAQIFSILRAHLKLSFFIIFMLLSLTVLILAIWPRTYMATVSLMVNYEVNDPLQGKELPVGQVSSYIATQVELIQTREVLLTVVDRLNLTQNEDYTRGYNGSSGTLAEWVARKISNNLVIYQGQQGSQLIYIDYSANNPTEAAQVANTIAEAYKEQDHLRSTGPPDERAKRYAQQLEELKNKVVQAQKQVTQFYKNNNLFDDDNKSTVDLALLSSLEQRLLEARNARHNAEARAGGDQTIGEQALSSTLVQSLKTKLAVLESRLAQHNVNYTSAHPDGRELRAEIIATRRSLASALGSYSANASAEMNVTHDLEKNLQRAVEKQRAKVLARSRLYDDAAKYKLELESAQTIYKRALEDYDQIMFSSGIRTSNVSFVSRATPPVKAKKPKVLMLFLLGTMASIALGLGLPLIYELLNRRVRCRDDLERHHGIPVLVEFDALPMRTVA